MPSGLADGFVPCCGYRKTYGHQEYGKHLREFPAASWFEVSLLYKQRANKMFVFSKSLEHFDDENEEPMAAVKKLVLKEVFHALHALL